MFENCSKLKEISFYDNIINIYDEEIHDYDEYSDYTFDYNDDNDRNGKYNKIYENLGKDDINSDFTIIKIKEENKYNYNLTINNIKDNIKVYKYSKNLYYDMSYIFYNCLSLSSLPDISVWNTQNIIDICGIFYNCLSLIIIIT